MIKVLVYSYITAFFRFIQLTKAYSTTFPRKHLTEEISDKFYEEMITELSNNMKNHKGLLESMVLDIYEKSGGM